MKLINYDKLKEKINNYNDLENSIIIDPILNSSQISSVCVDLRLDSNFYVPIKNKNAIISGKYNDLEIQNFFEKTYRKIGDSFIIYPNQYIIANTLEYFRIPNNVHAELAIRSSYDRLGLELYSIVQPGYSGVLTINIKSHSEIPIELICGARIAQIKFFDNDSTKTYRMYSKDAKYFCAVEPELSKLFKDNDNSRLEKIKLIDM